MERIRIKPAGWLLLMFAIAFPTILLLEKSAAPKSKLGRPLRVGIEVWPGYAAGIYANGGFDANEKSLFYRDCGLEVQFRILRADNKSRDEAFTHLTAEGKPDPKPFDVVWSTIDFAASELPRLRAKTPPIDARVFLQLDWSRGGDAIVADNSIQKIADLKGQMVSLDWNGPSGWLLASAVHMQQGLPQARDFVKVDDTGDPKLALEKFVNRDVHAAVLWEPFVTEARKRRPNDSHVLLSTRKAANLIADVLVARKDFIDEHRSVLADFCRCWLKAVADVRELPAIAVKPLMAGYDAGLRAVRESSDSPFKSAEETRSMLGLVAFAGEAENAELFGLYRNHQQDEHPLFDIIFQEALHLMSDDASLKPEDAKDTSILDRLLSPPPQKVTCNEKEDMTPVISRVFHLAGYQSDKTHLHELADTAQTYSHACIALAGPEAADMKKQLIQDFNLNEERLLVKTDGEPNRGTVYVLPDSDKDTPQPQLGD